MLSGSKIFTLIPLDKHSDGALGTLWIKVSKDYAWTLQMKSFGPQKCKFHAFWQFFRNRLIDWIGHVLLVQHSKTTHTIFFRFYTLIFIFFWIWTHRSSAWSFDHSDPDPSSVECDYKNSSSKLIMANEACYVSVL